MDKMENALQLTLQRFWATCGNGMKLQRCNGVSNVFDLGASLLEGFVQGLVVQGLRVYALME